MKYGLGRKCMQQVSATGLLSCGETTRDENGPILERLRLIVGELFDATGHALQGERDLAEDCMSRARSLLEVDTAAEELPVNGSPAGAPVVAPSRGCLAPWQIRRLSTYIDTHLNCQVTIGELARIVGLSASHFSRAFATSFGDPPHRYVQRRRLENAQGLMLTDTVSLSRIAADCGFSDQAHFNRLFRKYVGETPGAWRRARVQPRGLEVRLSP
jgi:AraC family transcriptional regulator